MKPLKFKFLLFAVFTTVSLSLYAQKSNPKVGFILANLYFDRWHNDKNYFGEKMAKLGGEVVFIDSYDNSDNQIKAAEKLVADGVDLLVVVPVDALASTKIVTIAHDAGVKVIAYDRLIMNCNLDYYISFNSVTVGEIMARFVIDNLLGGRVLNICGPSEDNNSGLIKEGVKNIFDPLAESNNYKVSHVHVSTWNPLDAYLLVEQYLATNDLPAAIICASDVLTRGVVEALQVNGGLGEVLITGQDAELDICKMLITGEVNLTIYKPIDLLAETAAQACIDIINGKDLQLTESIDNGFVDVPAIFLKPIPVTKETIDETVIKGGYYTKEEVYR